MATVVGFVFGLYLVGRAIVEPFVIDMTDPGSYRHDWGGSSLHGVLAVHCAPGLICSSRHDGGLDPSPGCQDSSAR